MKHPFGPVGEHGPVKIGRGSQVPTDVGDPVLHGSQGSGFGGKIQHHHLHTLLQQLWNQIGSNEPRPSCD
jgi:hypothetical protein